MLLLVGLGNPGAQYSGNRHNVGFQIVEAIADHHNFTPAREKFKGVIREGNIAGSKALILKPATFYNESGNSVREAATFYKIPTDKIFVIHDEIDLAPGKVKMKSGGGTAGNNGLKSISAHMGNDFFRIRIGIGHPGDKSKVTAHVLSNFSKSDHTEWLDDLVQDIARNVSHLMDHNNGRDRFLSAISSMPTQSAPTKESQSSKSEKLHEAHAQKSASSLLTEKKPASPFDKLKGLLRNDQEGKS